MEVAGREDEDVEEGAANGARSSSTRTTVMRRQVAIDTASSSAPSRANSSRSGSIFPEAEPATPDAPGDGRGSDPVDLLDVGFPTMLQPPPPQVSGVMSSSAVARSGRSTREVHTICSTVCLY